MSPTLLDPVSDPAAFRSVFAEPGEALILALVDPDQGEEISGIADAVGRLAGEGTPARLVVYGDSSAILPNRPRVGFLERWARPLLPAVLGASAAVFPLSEESESLLEEGRASGGKTPALLTDPGQLSGLFGKKPNQSGRRLLLQNDWGIGDELLLSAVARELIRAHPDLEIWIRSRHGFRFPNFVRQAPAAQDARTVETIYQNATLYGPSSHSPFPGHLVQQMLDKVALDTGLQAKAVDLRPELSIRPTPRSAEPTVVLHSSPNPRLPSKDWGLPRWTKLAEILRGSGVRIRQVGASAEPLLPGAEDLRGTPVCDLPEIVAGAWGVVSVVGFLMHLAEAAQTPTVVIYGGREHPAIDGYPDQIHLSSGPLPCRGRWGCHLGPDLDCPHGMKCMNDLTPELVAREVLTMIVRGGAR